MWLVEFDIGLLKKFIFEVLFEWDGFVFIMLYNNVLWVLVVVCLLNSYLENIVVVFVVEGCMGGVGYD